MGIPSLFPVFMESAGEGGGVTTAVFSAKISGMLEATVRAITLRPVVSLGLLASLSPRISASVSQNRIGASMSEAITVRIC